MFSLACGLGLCFLPQLGLSSSLSEPKGKLNREQKRLETLREQIRSTQAEKEAAGKKQKSLLRTLEESDQVLQLRRQEQSLIEAQLKEIQGEIDDLSASVNRLQMEINLKKERLNRRLRSSYIVGREASLDLFLEAKDEWEMARRYHYLKLISKREAQLLREYERSLDVLEKNKKRLGETRSEHQKTYQLQASKVLEVKEQREKRKHLLAKLKREASSREKLLEELKESAERLQGLIGRLPKQGDPGSTGSGFSLEKGQLRWPSRGPVLTFFGRQKHSKFDTLVYKKGIEIGAKEGDSIRTVFDGRVVYSDWFKGYGILIIIDHGDNYFSLYAHVGERLVAVGNQVQAGQVIGKIGETGFTQQAKLYFEIRHQGKPQDPLPWLKRRP